MDLKRSANQLRASPSGQNHCVVVGAWKARSDNTTSHSVPHSYDTTLSLSKPFLKRLDTSSIWSDSSYRGTGCFAIRSSVIFSEEVEESSTISFEETLSSSPFFFLLLSSSSSAEVATRLLTSTLNFLFLPPPSSSLLFTLHFSTIDVSF